MLIGISTAGLARKEALSCCRAYYPTYSWKRKIAFLWNLFWLFITPNLDKGKLSAAQQAMLSNKKGEPATKLFVLRHKLGEKSRLYGYLDYQGNFPGAFVKAAFSMEGVSDLQQEARHLSSLITQKGFSAPDLLWTKEEGRTACAIAQSPAPAGSRMINKAEAPWPESLLSALRALRPTLPAKAPPECSWWAAFQAQAPDSRHVWLSQAIGSQEKFPVCFSHGDLGSENIFLTPKGEYFVIDWECATDDGPTSADTLAYWLGQNNHAIRENIGNSAFLSQLFHASFVENHAPSENEALFALAFMVSKGFILACWIFDALYANREGHSS